jgi:predicted transcriptional regulator
MSYAIRKARSLIIRKELIRKARAPVVRKENVESSYRSKLVLCIEILCALASKGSMNLTQLTHKVEVDKARLIPHLRLLHNRGLIEKQNLGEHKIFYIVTERGLKVLKVISPIIREAHKIQIRNLEVISSTLSGAGYT